MPDEPFNLPPLITAMLSPGFYPHETAGLRLVQTHISYLLLTGAFVYKVKKPVDLGFANFSTLERRRHFCSEELRLNQRGAPGLYEAVLAVSQQDERFALADGSAVVEYAVKMRQFPSGALLSERLESKEVGLEDVVRLAKTVAAHHAGAATDARIKRFGDPDRVCRAIEGNYRHTERFVGGPVTREQFDRIRAFTAGFFKTHADLLRKRAADGSVRECHGDLHAANICFWGDRILLFDCIEFNEDFRFVDVMYDAAFVAMDLDAHGRPDLATRFINEYVEQTGDWEGLVVLPLYLCRQAYVRAKVNSLLLEDRDINGAEKAKAMDTARSYFALAERYALPRGGSLILMSGMSGSGKSVLAREVAQRIGAVHIRSDAVRKHMAGLALSDPGGPSLYTDDSTQRTYERLIGLGVSIARSGFDVILDARFDRLSVRLDVLQRARAAGLSVHILFCDAPDAVLRKRLDLRVGDVSDADSSLLQRQRSAHEPFNDVEHPHVTLLDTTQPPAVVVAAAVVALGQRAP